jgi:hypothetical protein
MSFATLAAVLFGFFLGYIFRDIKTVEERQEWERKQLLRRFKK